MTGSGHVQPKVEPGTRLYNVAVFLTHILNPTYFVLPLLLMVTYAATGSLQEGIKWAALGGSMVVFPILLLIHRKVRQGVYADSQVSVREQRHVLYVVGATCMAVYCAAVYTLDGPLALKATLLALFAAGLVAMAINFFISKVSIHTGGLAGLVTVTIIVFGRGALPIILLVPLVGWSRVVLGRHTIRQVVTGAVTAVTVTMLVMRAYGF